MDTFDQIIGGFGKIYELITANTWAATISVVGFAFLVIAIPACARAIKDDNPSFFLKTLVFFSLIGGMVFAGTGPSIALFGVAQGPILRVPATKAFDNLKENAVVHWLIRLIPFDPKADPQLAVGKLSAIGAKEQRYTFVAPYEELRGYSVEQAVRNTGGIYHPGYHVSAIIFQVANNTIYPASARGLLQVVSEVEKSIDSESEGKFLLKQGGGLDASDREDLNHLEIYSWRWDNYKQRYPQYCRLAHEFRCERSYTARTQIGGLYRDWHRARSAILANKRHKISVQNPTGTNNARRFFPASEVALSW